MDEIIDHNIALSAMVYVLEAGLKEIAFNARTIEEAQAFADDALDLVKSMKEKQYG